MIYAILIGISLAILGVSWFLYRRNFELFLCLLIAIFSEFFYLLPRIKGPEDYKLLLLPMIALLLFESLLTRKLAFGRYGWWVVSFLAISVLGVFVAWFSGQSLDLGIKAAKFIPLVMVYFLVVGRQIRTEKFSLYFIVMALAVSFVALIFFATHGAVNPFFGIEQKMLLDHLGNPRVTVGQFVIPIAAVMAFARYKQNSKIIYLFAAIMLFCEVLFIQQTRGFIASTFLSMCVVYVLSTKLTPLRISFYLFAIGGVFAASMVFSVSDFSSFGVVKRSQVDFSKRHGSYGGSAQARLNSYAYYWNEIQQHPIVGRGIYNFNWKESAEKDLQENRGIHLSDIGITHFVVQAGLVGVLWLVYGILKIGRDIWLYRKGLIVSCYFIIAIFAMPTLDILLLTSSLFCFGVFLGLTSNAITTSNLNAVSKGS
ncbi:MAG: hypothetical protein FD168_1077 [Desulfobulbaceae bacterium]|nr:MAG: hypothetical protein FD168_1077 [Desulfobulbaceae bacterium]